MLRHTYLVMQFRMSGIGRIGEVNMAVDGLTVILGENSTGKSTILKGLYSLAEAPIGFEKKKDDEVTETLLDLYRYLIFKPAKSDETSAKFKEALNNTLKEKHRSEELLQDIKIILGKDIENDITVSEKVAAAEKILNGESDPELLTLIAKRNLASEFAEISQIRCYGSGATGKLELSSGNKHCSILIDNNDAVLWKCDLNAVFATAAYYDTPFILDRSFAYDPRRVSEYKHRADLYRAISPDSGRIIDELISSKSSERFVSVLKKIIDGGFIKERSGLQYTDRNGMSLNTLNLAAGSKVFAILKLLAENGKLTKDSLILLDEPEIHLHPEWQNVLAELIVLLVKDIGAKVVMTTHSPQMLLAIQAYSAEHKQVVNYYSLEETEHGMISFTDLHKDLTSVYRKMADAYDAAYELYSKATEKGE